MLVSAPTAVFQAISNSALMLVRANPGLTENQVYEMAIFTAQGVLRQSVDDDRLIREIAEFDEPTIRAHIQQYLGIGYYATIPDPAVY